MDGFMCQAFPSWMLEAGPGLLAHTIIRKDLGKNPLLAVQLLMSAYEDSQPLLERIVLASGEATVPLLRAIDDGKIQPRQPRERYEEALLQEPWWALQYLASPVPGQDVEAKRRAFAGKLRARLASTASLSGQAALVHLMLNDSLDPGGYREQLMSDGMSAYLASRLLCARGFSASVDDVQKVDARWAVHIALWGGFAGGNVNTRIEDAIASHPGWAGEYVALEEVKQKDWAWVSGIYARTEQQFKPAANEGPTAWHELLWAMLDRICVLIEGGDPKLTLNQSFERSKSPPPPPQN